MNRNVLRDDKAVSPVIATILMVAITVVLAATLYMMVPRGSEQSNPVSGDLAYHQDDSIPSQGVAKFTVTLYDPSSPKVENVKVTLLDNESNPVTITQDSNTGYSYHWNHLVSDQDHVEGGDRLEITDNDGNSISNFEVIISVNGYQGTFSRVIP